MALINVALEQHASLLTRSLLATIYIDSNLSSRIKLVFYYFGYEFKIGCCIK